MIRYTQNFPGRRGFQAAKEEGFAAVEFWDWRDKDLKDTKEAAESAESLSADLTEMQTILW